MGLSNTNMGRKDTKRGYIFYNELAKEYRLIGVRGEELDLNIKDFGQGKNSVFILFMAEIMAYVTDGIRKTIE